LHTEAPLTQGEIHYPKQNGNNSFLGRKENAKAWNTREHFRIKPHIWRLYLHSFKKAGRDSCALKTICYHVPCMILIASTSAGQTLPLC